MKPSAASRPNARAQAAGVLAQVLGQGRSLTAALEAAAAAPDRALVQELVYGTLRWGPRLEAVLARLLQKPLKARDRDVYALMLVGLYQLLYLRVPDHAAIGETVEAVRTLDKPWAAGLMNGVLRHAQREGAALLAHVDRDPVAALAHPAWLLAQLRAAYPDTWQDIAAANNARPPMTLRVHAQHAGRDDYLARLAAAGLAGRPAPHTTHGIILEHAVEVERLPGFRAGEVSVQDGGAQQAAPLLDLSPGLRVLDACCAPGGKTAHILETEPALADVVALDNDPRRMARVRAALARLGLSATCVVGDAATPEGWWDGRPFDRILVDAPCSATGVIRRHPDIKYLRREADIPALARAQAHMLAALWPLLAPGGRLIYATCSVLPQENEAAVLGLLEAQADARAVALTVPWGQPAGTGRQILPGADDMDGFYYACVVKDRAG